ncbi:MAG TPA: hypothetical protein VF526_03465 [Solirubrobacteraceae bacterium]|jgi:hypothetical protein
MAELELNRISGRLYALEGVGTLRFTSWTSRAATAEAGRLSWQITRSGIFGPVIHAADATGALVGNFKGRTLHGAGTLQWGNRPLSLRRDSFWRQRYVVVDGDRPLVILTGKGWGKRRVKVVLDDAATIDPGLLLFVVFVVRALATDAVTAIASG